MLLDGNNIESFGHGEVDIEGTKDTIKNELFVRMLKMNFISVSKAAGGNFSVLFNKNVVEMLDVKNYALWVQNKTNWFFLYNCETQISFCALAEENVTQENKILIKWHERYGHVNFKCLKNMAENWFVFEINIDKFNNEITCEICG